jgi:predicted 3-demethylubiquinone-9 3-methyltransferase (glyoxalase superfamily)
MQKITPCLWFDDQAEEAVNYYVSTFENGKIGNTARYDAASAKVSGRPEGSVLTMEFELDGQKFLALNGGPLFKFSEAVSFIVDCADQKEVDYYWSKLSAHPESEQCGWCKDKFGVSWQVVPKQLGELLATGNPKVMEAMLSMKKIDVAALQKAAE